MTSGTFPERKLLFLIGAVQFVNILDFIMVMPLGPDFARALGIPTSKLGLLGGSYTAAAAVAGMAGARFLDRFDRRRVLGVAMAGLVLGTLAGGFAAGLRSLLAARVLAGAFGGPAAAMSLAIISDVVPPERRGRAMGLIMGAFAAASVLGVPAGLELARVGGWRLPFFAVAGLGAAVAAGAVFLMPPLTRHLRGRADGTGPERAFLRRPAIMLTLAATALVMMANFALIPNLSTYLQCNLGYPRERLGLLYLVGGVASFAAMRLAGRLTDRMGATAVAAVGFAFYAATLIVTFIAPVRGLPVAALFVGFMISASFRMIPMQSLSTRVPGPAERARFMSTQSAVQHLAAATGAIVSTWGLREGAGGRLEGIAGLAWLAIAMTAVLPLLLWRVESRVRIQESTARSEGEPVAALPSVESVV